MTVLKRIITAIKVKRHFRAECPEPCVLCRYLQLCAKEMEMEDAELVNDMLSKSELNTEYGMSVKEK